MCLTLLTITPFGEKEHKARNINGKGGAIFHQAHPLRTFTPDQEPGINVGICLHSPKRIPDITELNTLVYQKGDLVHKSTVKPEDKITIIQVDGHYLISWIDSFALPNIEFGLTTIKAEIVSTTNTYDVSGEASVYFMQTKADYSNSWVCFFKNLLLRISPSYRSYVAQKNALYKSTNS